MPPKPPLDITTTRSPGAASRATASTIASTDGSVRARAGARRQVADELLHRQALALGQGRPEHRGHHDLVGARRTPPRTRPGRPAGTRMRTAARRRPRCAGPDTPCAAADKRLVHGRRMVREVVEHRHAPRLPHTLEPALDAAEGPEPVGQHRRRRGRRAPRRQSRPARCARCARRAAATRSAPNGCPWRVTSKCVVPSWWLDVSRLPVGAIGQAEGLHGPDDGVAQPHRVRAVGAEQHQPGPRHQPDQPPEGQQHRIQIVVDVGVVELDVADDGHLAADTSGTWPSCRRTRCRTRRLRSRSAAPGPPGSSSRPSPKSSATPPMRTRRVEPAVRQQPPGQRGRGGLAVRARHHDRARIPQEEVADRLRHRAVAQAPLEHGFQFGVAARDGVPHDHEIQVGRQVVGRVAARTRGCLRRPGSRSSADRRSRPTPGRGARGS